jgi:hypothetical protein
VLNEWCEHIIDILKNNRRKLLSSISLLKEYDILVPDLDTTTVQLPEKTELFELVEQKLINSGFTIIKNWDGPLSILLDEAVKKQPPFENGDKGFRDAVILESYIKHTIENFKNTKILIVSNDNAIKRSQDRFLKHGIAVDFLGRKDIVEKLKSLLKDEEATYLQERDARLKKYVFQYENKILDYVKKTSFEITDWFFDNPIMNEEDRLHGSVEKILSVRPTKISNVFGGAPIYSQKTLPETRYPVAIYVQIELDIVVKQFNVGLLTNIESKAMIQPNIVDKNTPAVMKRTTNWQPQEIIKTIKRDIPVYATIDAEKEKNDIYDDFRIEKIT